VIVAATPKDVAAWLRQATRVMVLTGAGISTESGIPDFRGPNGVWTKNPRAERLSDIRYYMADRSIRVEAWKMRLERAASTATPNAGHLALAQLERKGKLQTLVTQNVDGLHLEAGSSPDVVIEIHGSMREVVCMSCGVRAPMEHALERIRGGEDDPPCLACGGILKSATISFGQSLDADDLQRAQSAAAGCQLFMAVGTSLAVYPAANLPAIARASGARLVIINAEPTAYDADADAVFDQPIGTLVPAIVDQV
jgi:NAD-dependent deacetylase